MRWAKQQGGVTGYPHSALHVNPQAAALRLVSTYDDDGDGFLSAAEIAGALLPKPVTEIDDDGDGRLTADELTQCIESAANELPNFVCPGK